MNDCSIQQPLGQNLIWFLPEHFALEGSFKITRKSVGSFKNNTRDLQNSLTSEIRHVFMYHHWKFFNVLNSITLKQTFWKAKIFFKRLEYQETHHNERSFASNCFILLKILVQFKNLLLTVDLMYQLPKYSYPHFRSKRWSFSWECFHIVRYS